MADRKTYHHGDLRPALLAAAEAELAESGMEAFSLRSVAKRAGVSHAAPAHHFGDSGGLLTALAAEGHRQFLNCQHRREATAAADPMSQMIAGGLGYVDFALDRPALFRLIFTSSRLNKSDPEFHSAGAASYQHLVEQSLALGGGEADVTATWAMVHGLADLLISGRLAAISRLPAEARDQALAAMIRRVLPQESYRPVDPGGQVDHAFG